MYKNKQSAGSGTGTKTQQLFDLIYKLCLIAMITDIYVACKRYSFFVKYGLWLWRGIYQEFLEANKDISTSRMRNTGFKNLQ